MFLMLISRKLHAINFTALPSTEPELLLIKVLHCRIRDFRSFCCSNLDLNVMTFIYKHDLCSLKMYQK